MQFERFVTVDLDLGRAAELDLGATLYQGDTNPLKVGVKLVDHTGDVSVSGSAAARGVAADGQPYAPLTTGISGNKAWAVIPQVMLGIPGHIDIWLRLAGSTDTAVTLHAFGTVRSTGEGEPLSPGTPVPNLEEMQAAAAQAVAAAEAAAAATEEHFPGDGKLVAGTSNQATRNNAVATGNHTTASGANSHAEGNGTTASGQDSHAEGQNTTASQGSAHAEGMSTTASGSSGAHAEGSATEASGQTSHAEGYKSKAQGKYSHAQGNETVASGESSHAEGYKTVASGKGAHAEGYGTHAAGLYSHVFGRYNEQDLTGDLVEIVGNGVNDSARYNARTLDWSGNEALAGSLTLGMGTADEVTITAAQLKQLLALLS